MAALADADRAVCSNDFQKHPSIGTFGAVTKADIRAAINAIDDYLVTNASAINSAIPQPARGQLTVAQKAILLEIVVNKRYVKGA